MYVCSHRVSIVRGRKQRKETFALSGCHFHANPEQLFMRQCRRKIAFLDVERVSMENNKNNICKYLLSGGVHRAFSFVSICIFFGVIDTTLGKANQNTLFHLLYAFYSLIIYQ